MRFRFITLSLHLAALLAFAVLPSCDKDPLNSGTTSSGETGSGGNNGENSGENDGGNSGSGDNTGDNTGGITGGNGGSGNDGGYTAEEGLAYVFDGNCIPEIHISVTPDQWNALLNAYDADSNTATYISCNVLYDKAGEQTRINDCGLRLKGNTSRRRPEGNTGQMHEAGNTDWHHCHFQLNFTKNFKDTAHELHGVKKLYFKWFKDDPAYVRELYCYDLFRRYGIWTAPHSAYCRLWIKVEGDPKEAYYGVYDMIELIDGRYANAREQQFVNKDGFVWKCSYGATLNSTDSGLFGNDGSDKTYELKTQTANYAAAEAQLKDFILKLTGKGEESFYTWIKQVCDVELLLKTYAVNVAVGMWDDYWNNKNNFYIYFNSQDKLNYKFFFIPYDYDNALGTSSNCGNQSDSGRQDPFNWGDNGNLLIYRLLKFEDFRKIYNDALLELCSSSKDLFCYSASTARIRAWQDSIRPYVQNDTGEDMSIEDRPASWGNHGEYRILDPNNNFFLVKTQTINQYCK